MQLGFIGLGRMGSRMAGKLLQDDHEVIVWNRSSEPVENLKSQISNLKSASENLKVAKTIAELVGELEKPRIIWVMVPQGLATQKVLDEVTQYVGPDDIVIDGGNAHFSDTQRRYEEFKKRAIKYLGIGVSGGLIAFENGYPLMVGGSKEGYEYIKPILDSLAKPHGGHEYFGQGGAGHFVKMVHNGIEYGIMQSLGEGFGVLEKSDYKFDLEKVARLWQKGSLVSGFMLDRVVDAISRDPKLLNIQGYIEESGEAKWTIAEAKRKGLDTEIIQRSLEFRKRSQTDEKVQNSFAARMVAALRQAFGGHEVKKK